MDKQAEKIVLNDDVKDLVIQRLKTISPETLIYIGSEGEFTRDQLVHQVENETDIGEIFAEIEMDWLQSFK